MSLLERMYIRPKTESCATIVDWNRRHGRPDNASILMRYDQVRFEAMIERALAAR